MQNKSGRLFIPFLRLIRWPNLIIVIITQGLVMYALIGRTYAAAGIEPALDPLLFFILVSVTVIIAAAGYIINDYFDLRTDRINKPRSVVIGRFFPRRIAIKLHIIFNSIAIAAGFYLSLKIGSFRLWLIFPLMTILLWFYSERYKRKVLSGNLAVAFMSAMVVIVVWLFEFFALRQQPDKFMTVYTQLGLISRVVLTYAVFAFLLTLVREVVKDAEDVEGDAAIGCRTLPVVFGIRYSGNLAIGLLIVTLLLTFTACWFLIESSGIVPAAWFLLFVAVPVIYVIFKVKGAVVKAHFHRISNLLKLIMLSGIAGLVVLSFYL
ncbi:MAG: geranylgeranylglycerol-phosphate geranylgeranyltransferase [Lentimicrobium sp.]